MRSPAVRALLALTLVALGVALSVRSCAPTGGGGLVTGRVVGPVGSDTVVLLVDPPVGIGEAAAVGTDGGFSVRVPAGAREPWVVIDTRRGALVRTQGLSPTEGATLPPMAVWETDVRVRTDGGRVRIDWSAIPTGREGFPRQARYSVLLGYARTDRVEGEHTIPVRDPVLELDVRDEVLPYLPQLDPTRREVQVVVRAFDPEDPTGPWWHGGEVTWTLPPE